MYKTVLLEDLKILDNQLKSIFDKLGDFPIENIKNNTRNSWSIEQHLYHCYLVEKLSLSYIQKKTLYPQKLISPGLTPCVRFYLLKFILNKRRIIKIIKKIKGLKNIVFDNQIKCRTPKIEII